MSSGNVKAIDLFCGAGGSSYGAQNAGATIVSGIDMWEPAIKTYKVNFPNAAKVYSEDIRKLCPRRVKEEIGNVDLILASPECIHHSRAKGNGERSEESRRTVFEVTRFAEVFEPEWIVIENVVEMRKWEGYKELFQKLEMLEYSIKEATLNAKNFNVPQSRTRLFLLCSKSGEPALPSFQEKFPSVDDVIDKKGRYRFSLVDKPGRAEKTLSTVQRAIDSLGEETRFLLVYYGSGRNGGSGGWQKVTEPLRTITTLDRFAYVVPGEDGHMMRMLQPEELKLAMGYGADFKLDEVEGLNRRMRIKLMGNGVCPPVMEAIVTSLTTQ